jgi:hypothetical protein
VVVIIVVSLVASSVKFNIGYDFSTFSVSYATEICDSLCLLMSINFELKHLLMGVHLKYRIKVIR